jgi:hypothetical protein
VLRRHLVPVVLHVGAGGCAEQRSLLPGEDTAGDGAPRYLVRRLS